MGKPRILLADNSRDYRSSTRGYLELEGYQVAEAASVEEAKQKLDGFPLDLVLVDLRLTNDSPNDISGLEVVEKICKVDNGIPWILLTAYVTIPAIALERLSSLRIRDDGHRFWMKPASPKDLLDHIRALLSPTILHISDLHFEPSGKSYENSLKKLVYDLHDLKTEFGIRPNLAIVSGDIAHQCLQKTYPVRGRVL